MRDFGLRGERWDSLLGARGRDRRRSCILLPAALPAASTWLFDKSQDDLSEAARELTDRATDPLGVVLLVLIVGIGAPIVEEIFYRGLLQRSLESRFGTWPAIVGSGVIFGASHFQPLSSRHWRCSAASSPASPTAPAAWPRPSSPTSCSTW